MTFSHLGLQIAVNEGPTSYSSLDVGQHNLVMYVLLLFSIVSISLLLMTIY